MNLSKSLKNRIVGILVLLSIVLIFIPALMSRENTDPAQSNVQSIAITKDGAVTDERGQLVSANERDYSDLLDPIDDTVVTPSKESPFEIAKNNASKDNKKQENFELAVPELEDAIPTNTAYASEALKTQETLTSKKQTVAQNNSNTEVLRSNNSKNNQKPAATNSRNNTPKKQTSSNVLSSGSYAAQYGVFSQQKGVDTAVANLKKLGFAPVTQRVNVNGKDVIKVYAGVSKDRKQAMAIVQKCSDKTKTKCLIKEI
ncbi:MAG: SPOR domain-containing protein [Succinivibrio sp.]|nr:SPOR domain-containing protein [Succinivibrio sp.]